MMQKRVLLFFFLFVIGPTLAGGTEPETLGSNTTPECGVHSKWGIQKRIKDCDSFRDFSGASWNMETLKAGEQDLGWSSIWDMEYWALVMRTKDGKEYWQDLVTQVIWGPAFAKPVNWNLASSGCDWHLLHSFVPETEGLGKLGWGLPKTDHYREAETHYLRGVLETRKPNAYWWTDEYDSKQGVTAVFDGSYSLTTGGKIYGLEPTNQASARCILVPEDELEIVQPDSLYRP